MKLIPSTPLRIALRLSPEKTISVGRLAMNRGVALFEYSPQFLESGLVLNPFFVPPTLGTVVDPQNPRDFDGLHGVFADSLPDAWGRLVLERRAQAHGISFVSLHALDLLAIVGHRGPGALVYDPETLHDEGGVIDLDVIAAHAIDLADGGDPIQIDQLERLAGPSGGARPKILVGIGPDDAFIPGDRDLPDAFEHWIIKFRSSSHDGDEVGSIEAAYADMARAAGLVVSPTRLLVGRHGRYFATKRFDRLPENRRVHMLSATAMFEARWDIPSADYDKLLRLTRAVTRDESAVEAMFRRMVFNVVASNRDDHTHQHAFLMDEGGQWRLAPAYDLTFNRGPGNEHYLAVGRHSGDDIVRSDVETLAKTQGLSELRIKAILEEVADAVADFPRFAEAYGVTKKTTATIYVDLQRIRERIMAKSQPRNP
jgi:serine/threonine-protein kinase HipA